jgi:hypothetical protein
LIFLLVLVLGSFAAWLAAAALAPKASAVLVVTPTVRGTVLSVDGSTDLPDGTLMRVNIWHEVLDEALNEVGRNGTDVNLADPRMAYEVDQQPVVIAGRFRVISDLSAWPRGQITIWTGFEPSPDQPPATVARFGANGERLGGPGVTYDNSDGVPRLVDIQTVAVPPTP